jgi:hypothetical protein
MTTTALDLERLAAAPHGVRDPLPEFFLTATSGTPKSLWSDVAQGHPTQHRAGAALRLVTRTASSPFGPRPVLCTALIARTPQGVAITTLASHGAN